MFTSSLFSHSAHRALAIWSFGAPGDVIEAAYKLDSSYQRPMFKSPEPITLDNFKDHVADKKYLLVRNGSTRTDR